METKENTTNTKEVITKDKLSLRDYFAAKAMQAFISTY